MSAYKDYQLVILRHGESEWNKLNLFTGWRDVRLSEQGVQEARAAGRTLKQEGFAFDVAHTSLLSRAIQTLWLAEDEMDLLWLPVFKHWRLNERHYGALQGSNKLEAVQKFGEAQVKVWRRSYATPPPPVDLASPEFPGHDRRYGGVPVTELPRSESLKDVLIRVMPYWEQAILPDLKAGKRVIIAAHGNSLRALLKYLEGISDDAIVDVDLPTGIPKAYRLNASYKADDAKFLGDPAELERRINAVKAQTKRA
ncbi:MAG: 2,3-diphosphoglycerate-dependent phosphoglycerate mutase [Alphaproteobacteria bacterium]|nr:2,3-diphosphoglycerate-dependent phosphoglycerate mutase [Alphaproteobacteria bacterium]